MNAEPVLVPRWWCTFGTRVVVVAAECKADAQAIVAGRLPSPSVRPEDVRARRLRVDDEDRLARVTEQEAALLGRVRR